MRCLKPTHSCFITNVFSSHDIQNLSQFLSYRPSHLIALSQIFGFTTFPKDFVVTALSCDEASLLNTLHLRFETGHHLSSEKGVNKQL